MEFLWQIGLVILLVLLNGYFVASEFALVAVRKTRVDELVKKGNVRAKLLKGALDELDSYISATQLGITLASLALGWIGEPAIAHFLEPLFTFMPATGAFITAHTLSIIIAFTIITFLHIVLGELAPKTVALQRAEKTSRTIITPLDFFTKVFKPAIWILNGAGRFVLKIFGLDAPSGASLVHSEEEIKMLLSQSSQGGAIPKKEAEMVLNALTLGEIPVKSIMVPRTDILAFNVTTPLKHIVEQIEKHPHSRFPVFENTIDTVVGFIHVKDVYRELLRHGENLRLSQLKITREIINVPEMKKIDEVLQDMRKKRIHISIVKDEFGGTAGIVSLEDIIESLVGEIDDEFDKPLRDIVRQKDGSYQIGGLTLIDDVNQKFHLPLKGLGYTTIGGLVFGLLGHEPRVGDSVQIGTISLEVRQIEGKRIKLLKLKRNKKTS
jgi:CBS domain containing-hemolysin-like protein